MFWWYLLNPLVHNFSFTVSVSDPLSDHWWEWGVEISYYYCVKFSESKYLWPLVRYFYKYKCPCIWSIDVQNWEFILVGFSFFEYVVSFPTCFDNFCLKVYFIGYYNGYTILFLGSICLEVYFPTFYSEVVSVFFTEVYFLYAAKCWIVFTICYLDRV
jgi:hypothetical protein